MEVGALTCRAPGDHKTGIAGLFLLKNISEGKQSFAQSGLRTKVAFVHCFD